RGHHRDQAPLPGRNLSGGDEVARTRGWCVVLGCGVLADVGSVELAAAREPDVQQLGGDRVGRGKDQARLVHRDALRTVRRGRVSELGVRLEVFRRQVDRGLGTVANGGEGAVRVDLLHGEGGAVADEVAVLVQERAVVVAGEYP